jgi:hypothetical protein
MGGLSLLPKIPFPGTETVVCGDLVRVSLLRTQTEHLRPTRPFDREIAESGHAHVRVNPPSAG